MSVRAISYGGGVQSTAMLVLAARREIDFPVALFANVGDDTENPETLRLIRTVYAPWARSHGIEVKEVHRTRRDGTPAPSIIRWVEGDKRSVRIPMRMPGGAPGRRTCTDEYKRKPIAKELKRLGASADRPAILALGISIDEWDRMRTDSGIPHVVNPYPLIDLLLSRDDCRRIIADAGLPEPPKSSCIICPFHTRGHWQQTKREHPAEFERCCRFEETVNANRSAIGRDPVYIHPSGKSLRDAVNTDQMGMFDGASCDIGGYCHS
jgi:hypothetical protein